MIASPHPPPDLLAAFGLGALAAADSATVERHLSECRTCQDAVASVPDDDVVRKVRSAAPAEAESRPPNLAAHMLYRGLRPHARGGLGEVSVGWDEVLGREVAVKRVLPSADDDRGRRRFLREAAVTGQLDHPGVVPVYGLGEDDAGRPCYAMRFVRGQTLREAIRAHHANPNRAGLRVLLTRFVAVCQTAAYAHSRGVVHRDIKPGNIVIGPFGEAVLLDWGLALTLAGGDGEPAGAVLGTPGYRAPEQTAGEPVGPAADVFALGATLFTLLTDRTPGATPGRGVSAPLLAIARKAAAEKPADRYSSPLDLAADVDRWLADEPVSAYRDPVSVRGRRWVRRHQTAAVAGVVLTVAAAVAMALGTFAVIAEQRRTRQALGERTAALGEARGNLALARQTVDRYTTRVAEETALGKPGMEGLRADLLADAREFYDDLARRPSADPAVEAERAMAYARLAAVTAATSSEEDAARLCEDALSRLGPLVEAEPDRDDLRRVQRDVLTRLAKVRSGQAKLKPARDAAARAAAVAEGLAARNPGRFDDREALAFTTYDHAKIIASDRQLVGILLGTDTRKEARAGYGRAADLVRALRAEAPANPRTARFEWRVMTDLLSDDMIDRDWPAAERRVRAALRTADDVAKLAAPTPEDRHLRARNEITLGELLLKRGAAAEAAGPIARAVAAWDGLVREYPRTIGYAVALASARKTLGDLHTAAGRPGDAAAVAEGTVASLEPVAALYPDRLDVNVALATALFKWGEWLADSGRPADALPVFDRQLAVAARPACGPVAPALRTTAHAGRAIALGRLGRPAEAVAAWEQALNDAPANLRPAHLAGQARERVRAGDAAGGLATADELAGKKDLTAAVHFALARVYATAAATDPAGAARLQALSVRHLRRAADAGAFKTAAGAKLLAEERDFDAVRNHPDFPRPGPPAGN